MTKAERRTPFFEYPSCLNTPLPYANAYRIGALKLFVISSSSARVESGTVSTWLRPKFLGNKYGSASGLSAALLVLRGAEVRVVLEGVSVDAVEGVPERERALAGRGAGENLAFGFVSRGDEGGGRSGCEEEVVSVERRRRDRRAERGRRRTSIVVKY